MRRAEEGVGSRAAGERHGGDNAVCASGLESAPQPVPNRDDAPFWEGCAARVLRFQRCAACGHTRHPPLAVCPLCRSRRVEWAASSGVGRVYTFTILHHSMHESVARAVPYTVVLVQLDDCGGVRLASNLVDCAPSEISIGMRVQVTWEHAAGGMLLPRFRRVMEDRDDSQSRGVAGS